MSRDPQPASTVHSAAAIGFGQGADTYVRGRPEYPAEVSTWLSETLGLHAGTAVVDLGAGTGKFTPRLLETGARVIAVEPVAAMRDKLSAALPDVAAMAGTADSIPLPDASVDAVICAQAFHWFANAAALTEIQRVLKPGGRLGLIWNVRDERVAWVARLTQIVDRVDNAAPRYASGAWRKVFPFAGFSELQEQQYSIAHVGTPEDVILNRVLSTSFIAALPLDQRAEVERQVIAMIEGEPELKGASRVTFPYETVAFRCNKIA
jgi:SAM-dependent methyltransferase